MKKLFLPLLLALLMLAGCQSLYPDDDLYVSEHVAPFAYRETETEPPTSGTEKPEEMATVSCASDIREAIKHMLDRGESTAQLRLLNYDGDVDKDMKNMYYALRNDTPKYAYCMDGPPSYSVTQEQSDRILNLEIVIQKDVQAIRTRLYKKDAIEEEIITALRQQLSSYTIQISGYQETDWYSLLDAYVLEHPDQIVEAPSISVYVFPDRGRIRVLELHFDYNTDQETLSQRKIEVNFFLNLILNQLSRSTPEEMVETISKYLLTGTGYVADPNATVYSQVVLKTGGSSRTMASTVAYLCNRAGAECEIVEGERDGVPWYWNRIMTDGRWRSFDLHAAALVGDFHPVLLPSEEMLGYSWDALRYPEVPEPEPAEPTETGDPSETGDPTETGEPTEPTEPAEPTGPTEPTEPIQSTEATESTETP